MKPVKPSTAICQRPGTTSRFMPPSMNNQSTSRVIIIQKALLVKEIGTPPMSNIGAIVTPLLIPPFAVAFGWKAAFVVTGGLGFLWLAGWWWGTRNLTPVGSAPERAPVNWGELLSDRRSWAVIGANGVHIFDQGGTRIGQIRLPEICSNVCFGGTKRNRLFMTGSQSLYACYVETRGAHIT